MDDPSWSSLETAAPPETPEMARIFRRVFTAAEGQEVLAHLRALTIDREMPALCTEAQLRDIEGQRRLFRIITGLIAKGQNA